MSVTGLATVTARVLSWNKKSFEKIILIREILGAERGLQYLPM